jgi:uncharacterized protein with PIN domain
MPVVKRCKSPPRFVADAMLGSLARRLRLLGLDTLYDPDTDDDALLRESNRTGRILVTADTELVQRPLARSTVLVPSTELDDQFVNLSSQVDIAPWVRPFTRCIECNAELAPLHKDRARDGVPPFVWQTNETFYRCGGCGRIYWRGSHRAGLDAEIERLERLEGILVDVETLKTSPPEAGNGTA